MKSFMCAQRGTRFGLLMIMLSALLWGTVGIFVQSIYSLSDTDPLSVGFVRLAVSVPTLSLLCVRMLGWQMFRIARRDLVLMLLMGSMIAIYQVCYFASIRYVGVAAATLITLCTAPFWVAILAALLFQERLTRWGLLAGVLAIAGTTLLVNLELNSLGGRSHTRLGILLALISALLYGSVTLCSRFLAQRYHPLQSLTVGFLAGAVLLFVLTSPRGLVLHYPVPSWLSLLYLGTIATAVAYLLYFGGMRHTSATVASIATLLEPLTSTVLAWWLLGEQLGLSGSLGAVLLLVAIGLLYWQNTRYSA